MELTINQVRNILYKLSAEGLVSFTRKKDKRKGWYTYFWTLNTFRALELLEKRLKKEVESLNFQLKSRETKRFYLCETCRNEVSEETALLNNFTCQECGEVYKLNEDKKVFNELKNKIIRLERQRNIVLAEINSIKDSQMIKRKRADKRAEKKKKDARKHRAKNKIIINKTKKIKSKKKPRKKRKV